MLKGEVLTVRSPRWREVALFVLSVPMCSVIDHKSISVDKDGL